MLPNSWKSVTEGREISRSAVSSADAALTSKAAARAAGRAGKSISIYPDGYAMVMRWLCDGYGMGVDYRAGIGAEWIRVSPDQMERTDAPCAAPEDSQVSLALPTVSTERDRPSQ